MFSPIFSITNRELLNLIEVEVASELTQLIKLQPEWEERLKMETLTRRIYSMAHFCGNELNLDDVVRIVRDDPGRDDRPAQVALRTGVVGRERDVQQVLNLLNVLRLIEQLSFLAKKFRQQDCGEKELLQINSLLGERLVVPSEAGRWREGRTESWVGDISEPVEIEFQLEDLWSWFGGVAKIEMHPINKAGIVMYEILRISPCSENNLLTAICFYQLVMEIEGYGLKRLWVLEEELLKTRDGFVQAIMSVERNGGEFTVWLDFLGRCLGESAKKTKTRLGNLAGGTIALKSQEGKMVALTERQILIMEEITLKNEVTMKEVRQRLPMVSEDTLLRDLKDLIGKRLIRKRGKTKGAVYVLGKIKSFR